ncbi:hypothetical protein HBA55_00565 [Pseudomaricurvus alkylphenolicus]|uniref:hypothetical protein n=1 Tax=Pseudomaricurvus alkylphenolicus TaxID=1306991 RepID=UPI0014247DFF|nr:hypothetical protein [Pseudomaricurvus alkylphenolicus]NIB38052.1 hypothetical protein [Pseudomaricurvus alkylphenolicus]
MNQPNKGYYTLTTGNDPQGRDAFGEYHQQGRYIYGVAVGILILQTNTPMAPGNMSNASSFNFPVLFEGLGDIDPHLLVSEAPDPVVIEKSIAAARRLQNQGVRTIVGNCGFFASCQQQIAAKLQVPFFSSSLMQVSQVANGLRPDQKVGIITANGAALRASPALQSCGLVDPSRAVIVGIEDTPPMQNVLTLKGHYSLQEMEQVLIDTALTMVHEHPEIGAFVLECSELSIHAHAIQDAVRLNVWDFTTLVSWMQAGCVRKPFSGWI